MPGVRIVAREYSNHCGRPDTCEVNASATTATWSPCTRSHTQASSESEAETAPHDPRRDSAELAARPGAPARTGRSTPQALQALAPLTGNRPIGLRTDV